MSGQTASEDRSVNQGVFQCFCLASNPRNGHAGIVYVGFETCSVSKGSQVPAPSKRDTFAAAWDGFVQESHGPWGAPSGGPALPEQSV